MLSEDDGKYKYSKLKTTILTVTTLKAVRGQND